MSGGSTKNFDNIQRKVQSSDEILSQTVKMIMKYWEGIEDEPAIQPKAWIPKNPNFYCLQRKTDLSVTKNGKILDFPNFHYLQRLPHMLTSMCGKKRL